MFVVVQDMSVLNIDFVSYDDNPLRFKLGAQMVFLLRLHVHEVYTAAPKSCSLTEYQWISANISGLLFYDNSVHKFMYDFFLLIFPSAVCLILVNCNIIVSLFDIWCFNVLMMTYPYIVDVGKSKPIFLTSQFWNLWHFQLNFISSRTVINSI